jgi:hypothetical protein
MGWGRKYTVSGWVRDGQVQGMKLFATSESFCTVLCFEDFESGVRGVVGYSMGGGDEGVDGGGGGEEEGVDKGGGVVDTRGWAKEDE